MIDSFTDLDKSTSPKKWKTRGPQPAYRPPPPPLLTQISILCRDIKRERNPIMREILERQFQNHVDAFDQLEEFNKVKQRLVAAAYKKRKKEEVK